MKKRLAIIASLVIILLALSLPAWPAAISSNGTGGGVWSATGSWSGGVVPGEGDRATIISGDTITLDEASRTCGDDTTTAAIQVNSGGKLEYLYNAAASATLIVKGDFKVAGTLEIGTTSNPIPNTRTFNLRLNYSATLSDGEYGLIIQAGGTWTCQGSDPWGNGLTDPDRTLLATDAAANATSVTVAHTTLWKANDRIYIAPTSRTYSQYDPTGTYAGQVSSASGTTLNLTNFGGTGGGLLYAHSGTSPNQAEIINLTRNIVIENYDGGPGAPGNAAYVVFETTATVDIDWTEFRYLGTNAADKYGIVPKTTSGSCSLNRCSIHDADYDGIRTATAPMVVTNCVFARTVQSGIYLTGASFTGILNNNWFIGGISSGYSAGAGIWFASATLSSATITNNRTAGSSGNGFNLYGLIGPITITLNAHGNNAYGVSTGGGGRDITIDSSSIRRNGNTGIWSNYLQKGITISNTYIIANTTNNINLAAVDVLLDTVTVDADASFATTYGIFNLGYYDNWRIVNSSLGATTGHTADIRVSDGSYPYPTINRFYLYNTTLGSATEVSYGGAVVGVDAWIRASKHDGTAGLAGEKAWSLGRGTITADTTYYATASPSAKLTPSSATYKLESGSKKFTIDSGQTATVTVKFRKSNAYNGAQPRLIVKRNDALGITADTVLATSTASNDADTPPGNFSTLTGITAAVTANGVLEVVVDCSGTAGYVNLDDWSVSLS